MKVKITKLDKYKQKLNTNKAKRKINHIDDVLYPTAKANSFEVEENFLTEKYAKRNFR